MTRAEALKSMTLWPARNFREKHVIGSISTGQVRRFRGDGSRLDGRTRRKRSWRRGSPRRISPGSRVYV